MKTPHKLFRSLGGQNSRAGRAFRYANDHNPFRALRSIFRSGAERDIAGNFAGMAVCKRGIQMIMAALQGMNKSWHGPRVSSIFSLMARRPSFTNSSVGGPSPE